MQLRAERDLEPVREIEPCGAWGGVTEPELEVPGGEVRQVGSSRLAEVQRPTGFTVSVREEYGVQTKHRRTHTERTVPKEVEALAACIEEQPELVRGRTLNRHNEIVHRQVRRA